MRRKRIDGGWRTFKSRSLVAALSISAARGSGMWPRASATAARTLQLASLRAAVRGSSARPSPIWPRASAAARRTPKLWSLRTAMSGSTALTSRILAPEPRQQPGLRSKVSSRRAATRRATSPASPIWPRASAASRRHTPVTRILQRLAQPWGVSVWLSASRRCFPTAANANPPRVV